VGHDPADRLLIATARDLGVPLVTRDRRILDYAAQGHVDAIAC
jgi:PIN domain nuclease of toxin-antitoxin system